MKREIYEVVEDFIIRELISEQQISPEMVEAIAELIESVFKN